MATFEGYSYRTSSRFGSRVWITVEDGTVTVTGPRVPAPLYAAWRARKPLSWRWQRRSCSSGWCVAVGARWVGRRC